MPEDLSPNQDIKAGFTKGLLSGYAGNTQFTASMRATFPTVISHLEENEYLYHDEWLKASTGGGQELLKVKDKRFTRLYAGGTISQSKLSTLGISEKNTLTFLIETLGELKEKTRLFEECGPVVHGDWRYHYQVLDNELSIPVTISKETIHYKDRLVFVHSFCICEVK